MPLRDYQCDRCGHQQEELVRHDEDEAGLTCRICGSRELTRQLSLPAPPGGGCESGFG
jgi:putative FmdB family regulatory protein